MKKLSVAFCALSILLANAMFLVLGYAYCNIYWQGKIGNTSAPASVAILYAIPFLLGICVCIVFSVVFWKKQKQSNQTEIN